MKGFGGLGEHKHQLACIVGMAMVWPSLHNQLLYPLTFSFNKQVDGPLYPYYLLYSLVMLAVTALLALPGRRSLTQRILTSGPAVLSFGVAGSLGIVILATCGYESAAGRSLIGVGTALAAAFVPVHFMFWSTRITHSTVKCAAFDLVVSYLVFCAITLFRLAFGLHARPFSIAYPLVSGALGFLVMRKPPAATYAFNDSSRADLPLRWVAPCVVFVYAATISRVLMSPATASYEYPPSYRVIMYLALLAAGAALAVLYRPGGKSRRGADLPAFTIVTSFVVAALVLAAVSTLVVDVEMGNYPAVAGINLLQVFIWMLVLSAAQTRHSGVVGPAALYLVFVVGACHLVNVLTAAGSGLFDIGAKDLPVLVINIVLAIAVVLAVNVLTTSLLVKDSKGAPGAGRARTPADSPTDPDAEAAQAPPAPAPACLTMAEDEAAVLAVQQAFGLSKRETDTLRLAARGKTTKEIAEGLFVAESTVNSHIKSIYRKCDVHSRRDLVALVSHYKKGQR